MNWSHVNSERKYMMPKCVRYCCFCVRCGNVCIAYVSFVTAYCHLLGQHA